jgi:hypothetical protein
VDWILLARNRSQSVALVNRVMNLGVPWRAGLLLASQGRLCSMELLYCTSAKFWSLKSPLSILKLQMFSENERKPRYEYAEKMTKTSYGAYVAFSCITPVCFPVTHACRKRRLKWVATLSLGDINTETRSSGMGVGRGTNKPTL